MKPTSAPLAPLVGLLLGSGIGYVDSRPTWDDTGITVGAGYVAGKLLRTLDPTTRR
jgi:hypothetical protein